MFALDSLKKIVKSRKRVGRGGARGKTSGRGSNGQLARSGGRSEIGPDFEGGQMSLCRRLPRRGFVNRNKKLFEVVSLDAISKAFGADAKIDRTSLIDKGLVKGRTNHMVKILGPGVKLEKMSFVVDAISRSASEAISQAGGTVTTPEKGLK